MFDIVVSGGNAVLPSGPEPADIGVNGEHVAAIGAGRTLDASAQIVIPGPASTRMSIATGRCRCPVSPSRC